LRRRQRSFANMCGLSRLAALPMDTPIESFARPLGE
jgi:hypothetical protein